MEHCTPVRGALCSAASHSYAIPLFRGVRQGEVCFKLPPTRKTEVGVDTQPLTKTVTTDSKTGDLGEILKQLDAEIEAETEDGYAGMLKLESGQRRTTVWKSAVLSFSSSPYR